MVTCPICQNKASFFHTLYKYTYYSCDHCQTLFLSPQPSQTELTNYYQKTFSFNNGLINEKDIRKRGRIILKQLRKLNPQGKTLLDIGSGYGFFLDEAQKTGLTATGLEPSKKLYDYSKKFDYSNNRICYIDQNFDQYYKKNLNKKFDFITAIHVIEHLNNPKDFIENVQSILNRNGILYIETPNLNSHLFRAEKQNYTFLTPPDHLWLFSFNSFIKLFESNQRSFINNYFTYSYPEHLMGVIKNKVHPSCHFGKKTSAFLIQNQKERFWASQNNNYHESISKKFKYLFFDKFLAQIGTPFLNLGGYGSILELYIKKKT